MRPELPTPRRSYGAKRSPWTTWIVLGGTLAVGAVLLVTMRAMFQVGDDMVRSVNESRLPPQKRGVRTAESRLREMDEAARKSQETAARSPAELAPSAPESTARASVATERIHGRVVFPDGTPQDEVAWVVLRIPSSNLADQVVERARVGSDGAFAFDRSTLPSTASVELDARYLYLAKETAIERGDEARAIELEPKLGARIVGRCVVAEEHAALRRWIAGAEVDLRHQRNGMFERPAASTHLDDVLAFTIDALPPLRDPSARGLELVLHASAPFVRDLVVASAGVRPGATLRVVLASCAGRSVAGRVVDLEGRAIVGASVDLETSTGGWNVGVGRDETDSDGRFEWIGVGPWVGAIRVRRDGYLPEALAIGRLQDEERRTGIEIVLASARSIAGRVLWSDGSPAAGASVAADLVGGDEAALRFALADDDGTFEFDRVGAGTFSVSARASIPSDIDDEGNPIEGRRGVAFAHAVAAGTRGLELLLGAGSLLRGRVTDAEGSPCTNFEVHASPVRGGDALSLPGRELQASFRTEDGWFELAGLHPGTWEVQAQHARFRSSPERVVVDQGPASVELVLDARARVSGVVLRADGTPAANAEVELRRFDPQGPRVDDRRAARTKADDGGRFEVEALDAGSYVVVDAGWDPEHFAATRVDLAPRGRVEGLVLRRLKSSVSVGIVVDERGAPLDHALVQLEPEWSGLSSWNLRTATRQGGRFRIYNVPATRYRLRASLLGRLSSSIPVEFPADDEREVRLVLERGVELHVIARAEGSALENVQAELVDRDGTVVTPQPDELWAKRESEVLGGLVLPGTYRLTVSARERGAIVREVVVADFEPVVVEVVFGR